MSRYEPLHLAGPDKEVRQVAVRPDGDTFAVRLDDDEHVVAARPIRSFEGGSEFLMEVDGRLRRAVVVRRGDRIHVSIAGRTHVLDVRRASAAGGAAAAGGVEPFAASPMTGVVLDVRVEAGETVAADAPLVVIEAMKMEFVVAAPVEVVVDEVLVAKGDRVDIGAHLVRFTPVVHETEDDA